jgi:hypothetical protein
MKRLSILTLIGALLLGGLFAPSSKLYAQDTRCFGPDVPGCTNGLPSEEYQQLLAQMQAHPKPDLSAVPIDDREVDAYSFWRVLPDTAMYDAPNGNMVGKFDNGFNFVIVYKVQDGFAQLRNKFWVPRSSLKQSYSSHFSGILFDKPQPYPVAWVIQASIPSAYPDGPRSTKTPAINRYAQVYIYKTVHVGNWDWFLVGPGQWLEQRKMARVLPTQNPGAAKWVSIDLYEQVLTAYEGDTMVYATLISSGLSGWQTNEGTFKVWRRAENTAMSGAMGQPDFYSLPAVPWVLFFDKEISLHGTYWHDGFGFKHSHGCVNMSISDARWIYNWVGGGDLTVHVWSSH